MSNNAWQVVKKARKQLAHELGRTVSAAEVAAFGKWELTEGENGQSLLNGVCITPYGPVSFRRVIESQVKK